MSFDFTEQEGERIANQLTWREFAADERFTKVRNVRLMQAKSMAQLRSEFEEFTAGQRELSPSSIEVLRNILLRLLQLKHTMESTLHVLPVEYEIVGQQIKADYDLSAEIEYMAKANGWLKLVHSGS